jgi:ankyrin repeat protein
MASPTPANATGHPVLRASKNFKKRAPLEDVDDSVINGVLRCKHGPPTNGDEPNVITLMGIARDGPVQDFKTAWGGLNDSTGNPVESTYVNLNRAVAFRGVKFEAQRKALEKLDEVGEGDIDKILDDIKTMQDSDKDGDWRTENIEENSRVGKGEEHLPVIWNACAVIYPGRTALHMAAANGQVDIVNAICHTRKLDFHAKDVFGYTPLHLACYSRSENKGEVITKLLEKQINPNVAAKEKGFYFTALHLAVKSKSKHIVDMLLDWNPSGPNSGKVLDVGAKSSSGLTALHLAVKEAIAVKKALLKVKMNTLKVQEKALKGKGNEALKVEKEKLEEEKVEFKPTKCKLLKERASLVMIIKAIIRFMNTHSPEAINKSDDKKSTPLHTSVEAGDYRLVDILLEDGDKIDPELLDSKRRTALEIAVDKRDYVMVQKVQSYLERAGIVGNHKAYADSATAILVGAALLVTVTFAAWVQIPTNDSTLFWVFISLSFYFAVATFIVAAGAAIPSKGSTLGLVRRAVLASAFCLAISLACAVAAFATAGFIIVPHGVEHQRKVIATTVIGGFVCLFCLLSFVRKILRASGLFILWLDYSAQNQFHKHICEPLAVLANGVLAVLAYGVQNMLGEQRVNLIKKWYEDNIEGWYTRHVINFFKDQEDQPGDECSTCSHNGIQSTTDRSPSSSGNKESGEPRSPEIC